METEDSSKFGHRGDRTMHANHSTAVTPCWETAPEKLLGYEPALIDGGEQGHGPGRNAFQRQQGFAADPFVAPVAAEECQPVAGRGRGPVTLGRPGEGAQEPIESGVVTVVRLTEVFRQAANSPIITNAHRINEGQMPNLATSEADSDFFFVDREEPERIADTLVEMVKRRIPGKFRLDLIRDIQVLCPMNRGSLGIRELNGRLQNELNPARPEEPVVEKFGWQFRVRDKVIQTENNYDKEVFNGDIGQIAKVDPVEREVTVRFDRREVVYEFGELDEVSLAYAITIHKSQESEFPAVVIPLATQHYLLLQRNLVYTGITRGKQLVVLVGQRKALASAARNNKTENRFSGLLSRLRATG